MEQVVQSIPADAAAGKKTRILESHVSTSGVGGSGGTTGSFPWSSPLATWTVASAVSFCRGAGSTGTGQEPRLTDVVHHYANVLEQFQSLGATKS